MRALVTGSSGFVGRWLLRELEAAGDQVTTMDEQLDIRDLAGLRPAVVESRPEVIYHLAAQASVAQSWRDPGGTLAVNVIGTSNLVTSALACPDHPRVLVVSSAEVYGAVSEGDLPLTEAHGFAPSTPYAASKVGAEMVGLQAWLGQGLEVIRVRPFNHTGPGQRPDYVVPSLAGQVARASREGAERLAVGNLAARRDFTDVRDVVRAYRLLALHGQPGEAYNVSSGTSVSVAEVAAMLIKLSGVDLPLWVDPALVRPVEVPDLVGANAKIRAATGWQPGIALLDTLRDVLEDAALS